MSAPKDPIKRELWMERLKKRKPANKGKKFSEEWRKKLSEAHTGVKMSESHRKAIALGHSGANSHLWKGGLDKIPGRRNWIKNKRNRIKKVHNQNGDYHTFGEWIDLKEKYNWTCVWCQKQEPEVKLTEDHIIPLSKGGSDNIANIQPLCGSCNCKKGTKIINLNK